MIRRIILDMDDVLNSFTMNALKYVGCPVGPLDYHLYPSHVGYEIVEAANHLLGEPRFTSTTFWNSIPREVWATVPISPECNWLIGMAEALVGQEGVLIGTTPTLDPDCPAGKTEWAQANLPRWLQRRMDIGAFKEFKAHPEALLIDDAEKNVNRFREWGGQAILVPRPWNANRHHNTQDYLAERFQELFENV